MELEAEENAKGDADEVVASDVYVSDKLLPSTSHSHTWIQDQMLRNMRISRHVMCRLRIKLPERTGWMPLRISVVARRGLSSETARATVSPSVKI